MKGTMPSLYVPHGAGPCFFMDWDPPGVWKEMEAWFRALGESLPGKPEAVVVISAHWEAPRFTATSGAFPPLIYDYYGFPEQTYQIAYPAPGSPRLAEEIGGLSARQGILFEADAARGWDHGVFVPLKLIFPEADIPVVQLSLKEGLDAAEHIALGRALAPLRDKGILLLGSGMSYHNLRAFANGGDAMQKESDAFDAWLHSILSQKDPERTASLFAWEKAPSARAAHPREEHLLPLMPIVGAAEGQASRRIFSGRVMGATVSAWSFG